MALLDAHTRFEYRDGTGPVAIYQCDDCGCFHLTSKGPMDKALAEYLSGGKVHRQKEANQWIERLKGRKGF